MFPDGIFGFNFFVMKTIYEREVSVLVQELKGASKSNLIKIAQRQGASVEELKVFKQRLNYAEERSKVPLSWTERLLFFVFPFGFTNAFSPSVEFGHFAADGFERKYREFIYCSVIGALFYIVVGAAIGFYWHR